MNKSPVYICVLQDIKLLLKISQTANPLTPQTEKVNAPYSWSALLLDLLIVESQ